MCGIALAVVKKNGDHKVAKRCFKSILSANEERGKDSSGVLAVHRDTGVYSLFKDIVATSDFVARRKFRKASGDLWVGHARLATTGAITQRNAHPLQRDKVILAHNGMIHNHYSLGYELNYEHEVDSEVLIPLIQSEDWDKLQEVSGQANIFAYNTETKQLYIMRHDNPLFSLELKDYGVVLMSSVESVLSTLAEHYGNSNEVCVVPNNKLYRFESDGSKSLELDLKFAVKHDYYYGGGYDYYGQTKPYQYPTTQARQQDNYEKWQEAYDKAEKEGALGGMELRCEACATDLELDEGLETWNDWGYELCRTCEGAMVDIVHKNLGSHYKGSKMLQRLQTLFGSWVN